MNDRAWNKKKYYGALSYYMTNNLGDEIQTIAALQFLPRVDYFVDRDRLTDFTHLPEIFLIMNGWFIWSKNNWPPPENIRPYFISFHADEEIRPDLVSLKYKGFYEKYEPIGCRSLSTLKAMEKLGVQAYFSGDLTLALEKPEVERGDQVYIVDANQNLLNRLVPAKIGENAAYLTHSFSVRHYVKRWIPLSSAKPFVNKIIPSDRRLREKINPHHTSPPEKIFWRNMIKSKFKKARKLLSLYASAKLVITGRLHCMLACLAFGTPVLFLKDHPESNPRLSGLAFLSRCYSIDDHKIDIHWHSPEPNPVDIKKMADSLRHSCQEAVREYSHG